MSEKLRSATGALAPVLEKALFHHQKGQLAEAASLYQEILADNPNNADALHLSGVIEAQKKRPLAAIALIDRAIAVDSNNATFFSNRARVLRDLRRLDDAVSSYDHALAITPADSGALINRGNALQALKRYEDALASYDRALAIKPDSIEALNNRAIVLGELKHFDEALASYDRALAIAPDNAELHYNRGDVLRELKRLDEALVSYNRALAIAPDDVAVLTNRAIVLLELRHFDEALASYDRALTIMPDQDFLFGLRLFCKMNLCDWHGLAQDFDRLAARIESGKKAAPPFAVLPAPLSAPLQKACAEAYVREKYPKSSLLPAFERRYDHDRIRLGYFSSDFRNHPVGALTAGLFERHDRAKFEVIGFSLGPPTKDAMRARLEKSFDRFIEVDALSDKDVALLARRLEIDVAIDLNGLTTGSRTSIFALRAAPIQVSYLGYPGTMGAPYIDYLIADATLIPEDQRKHYAEKLVHLPDTYQVNDSTRLIANKQFTRAECGLPEDGFVFCCFNNSYKIIPETFDVWMRLLKKIDGSVLWLSQGNNPAVRNLKGEAQARGVDPERLVFAPFLSNPEHHLARLRLADLFLDTLPYNAHATASDALWAGVPVLTCLGNTFPGRVAASALNAIGLPELIARNLDQYESLALELSTNSGKMLSLRHKLAANRLTQSLFDTARFTRHIESAFLTMWQRGQQGLSPEHIHVQPAVGGNPVPRDLRQRDETVSSHDRAPAIEPDDAGSLISRGNALQRMTRFDEALACYDRALAIEPDSIEALNNRGVVLQELKRCDDALTSYDRAVALKPSHAELHYNRGDALRELKRLDEALASYERTLAINPGHAEACNNRARILQELKRFDDALASYERALAIRPDYAEALNNLGTTLQELKRYDDALANYDRALARKPDYAEAFNNRGSALHEHKRFDEALASYDCAVAIKPNYARAHINRGIALQELKRYDEAVASYDRALAIVPDQDFLFGLRLFCKMKLCDWQGLEQDVTRLAAKIESGEKAAPPFAVLPTPLSAPLQRACAETYIREKHPESSLSPAFERQYDHGRIRLGYFSTDFYNHPVAFLTAGLFEQHDRARFKVIGFSLGPPTKDAMRARLEKSFDHFIEVGALSDEDVALLSRRLEIDIAIDLNGFTTGSRTNIFALRAAPIQVSYLGYPGTMGAPYIDYLIADATLIPEDQQKHYVEKLAYLPDTYQVNDSKRFIADKQFARAECGLPEDGFVFCCFNNSHKIAPGVFDIWMRLLNKINGSVLWLSQSNNPTMRNLKGEAQARGIDPGRLVFAPFLPNPEHHLARLRLAGLFLDTLPYNAHATASDALWAGVPVLTCLGQTLPGRVAASLLNAVGLPELITKNHDQYEALALQLATKPRKILSLRRKLAANRLTQPLFDTARFAGHIESAFFTMWQRGQQGLAPGHIHVQPEVARQAERS